MTWIIYAALGLAILLIAAQVCFPSGGTIRRPYSEFLLAVEQNQVQKARVGAEEVEWLNRGDTRWRVAHRLPGELPTETVETMKENGVEFEGKPTSTFWPMLLLWMAPILLLIGFWYFMFRRYSGRGGQTDVFGFRSSTARMFKKSSGSITFSDVADAVEAKRELLEIVDMLRFPQRYREIGAHIPKGVILTGPPGTGKTLLARATAGEADVSFFSISGSEFVEVFVGVGASRVRDLFEKAVKAAPSIIFVDEIESVGRRRTYGMGPGHQEQEQTLNQLLTEMDGFDPHVGVIVMAATNRLDMVDHALLRPGRFDRRIEVEIPDRAGRLEILQMHARGVHLASEVDLNEIAARTPGFSGASLANVINEAALLSARGKRPEVSMGDLDEAIVRVMAGMESATRVLSQEEKKRVAYHEMGHALASILLPHADTVHKVTIVSRSHALGMTVQSPLEDRYLFTTEQLQDKIASELAGRAAEELIFGDHSTGAANDLQQATDLARRMVREFGMSKSLGPVAYRDSQDGAPAAAGLALGEKPYSERVAEDIDAEIRAIISDNYDRVSELLKNRFDLFCELAEELRTRETITGEELRARVGEARGRHNGHGTQKSARGAE
ncbi:MAG: ATP-dependent zinc metalloprotease FtsH [Chloroflexota bacterium]